MPIQVEALSSDDGKQLTIKISSDQELTYPQIERAFARILLEATSNVEQNSGEPHEKAY